MHTRITPEGWPAARGYSYAVEHQGRIHVSGVIATEASTQEVIPGDFAAQWAKVWSNMAEILHTAGSSPDHVLSLRIYVTDLHAYRQAGRALGAGWSPVFADHLPAITLVEVSGLVLPEALLEAEAEAALR
jgi:enamine deaminase RidA (YjgF/YER057c/UK114 family)